MPSSIAASTPQPGRLPPLTPASIPQCESRPSSIAASIPQRQQSPTGSWQRAHREPSLLLAQRSPATETSGGWQRAHREPSLLAARRSPATETPDTWQRAHQELSRLAALRCKLDGEEGRWLLAASRLGSHIQLGFGSFFEYVESLFGYRPRTTEDKLTVAEALEHLPELAHALNTGTLSWSAVRELVRVAMPENEMEWLSIAKGRRLREIERLVAGRQKGDHPETPKDPGLLRHVLRFEVSAETMALFRDALAKLTREAGSGSAQNGQVRHGSPAHLDDDTALLLMARQILGGPTDPGRASYQVVLTLCPQCGRGWQQGKGELFEVASDVLAMANCDAQHVGAVDAGLDSLSHVGESEGSQPRAAHSLSHVGEGEGSQPRAAHSLSHVGEREGSQSRAAHSLSHVGERECPQAVVTDPFPHVGERGGARLDADAPRGPAQRSQRAHQGIPPSIRRQVLLRDQHRCQVPGCQSAIFLDVHHLVPRAEGGTHEPDTLLCLCAAHHRAAHRGRLFIKGRVSTGLEFSHADGTRYGTTVAPESADAFRRVFEILRGLGFRETSARQALTRVANPNINSQDTEQLLRAVLAELTS